MKKQKGITLIALILTIVVLMILAIVAINAVSGDDLIARANNATTRYSSEADKENTTLQNYLDIMDKYIPTAQQESIILYTDGNLPVLSGDIVVKITGDEVYAGLYDANTQQVYFEGAPKGEEGSRWIDGNIIYAKDNDEIKEFGKYYQLQDGTPIIISNNSSTVCIFSPKPIDYKNEQLSGTFVGAYTKNQETYSIEARFDGDEVYFTDNGIAKDGLAYKTFENLFFTHDNVYAFEIEYNEGGQPTKLIDISGKYSGVELTKSN